MERKLTRVSHTLHSSIRIERPCITRWGRRQQRRKMKRGEILLLEHPADLYVVLRTVFPNFFRLLDEWTCSPTHPTQQPRISTTYTQPSPLSLEAVTTLYLQEEIEEQVAWTLYPCSDGIDLKVVCSESFWKRLNERVERCFLISSLL